MSKLEVIFDGLSEQNLPLLFVKTFPSLDSANPVANIGEHTATSRKILIDGGGYRINFLDIQEINKITHRLASINKCVNTFDISPTGLHNYLNALQEALNNTIEYYQLHDVAQKINTVNQSSAAYLRRLAQDPEQKLGTGEYERIQGNLIQSVRMMQTILHQMNHEHPIQESDIISLKQSYDPSFDPQRQAINVLKAATEEYINQLNKIAQKLKPDYYLEQIKEILATHDQIRHSLIRVIGTKLAANNATPAQAIINAHRLFNILQLAVEHHLLKQLNWQELENLFYLPFPQLAEKLLQLYKNMSSLANLQLLMPETITPLFLADAALLDKSCPARTTPTHYLFFGKVSRSEESYKRMWSIYSIGVENKLVELLKANKSLTELMAFAARKRADIAALREEYHHRTNPFGAKRKSMSKDIYSDNECSIISTSLFTGVANVISQHPHCVPLLEPENGQVKIEYTLSLSLQTTQELIKLPDEMIKITFKKTTENRYEPQKVAVNIAQHNHQDLEQTLNYFDKQFLTKCRNKEYLNEEDFITELGKFTFYLVRFSPFVRGTGAIVQWQVRSLVSYYTDGRVNLGNICLGDDLPYDVYAQLVQTPEVYAEAFKKAVLPAFQAVYEDVFLIKQTM